MAQLDIVYGKKTNPQAVESLVGLVSEKNWDGTLYVGYPVFSNEDTASVTDALMTTKEHGVVIFDLSSATANPMEGELEANIEYRQKDLKRKLYSRLVSFEDLVGEDGITLAFNIHVVTFLPHEYPNLAAQNIAVPATLINILEELPPLEERFVKPLNAAIQRTAALRPKKKRLNVRNHESMGATIKTLEAQIANLDKWQKNAAIESPDGPQRIRGLAGSGKTIILAMKAAYLHANDPDAKIAVTFNSRALYQQFKGLIRRFYYDQATDEPDWDKLLIIHAWGSDSSPGFYSTVSQSASISPMTFGAAKYKFGQTNAFSGACSELVSHLKTREYSQYLTMYLSMRLKTSHQVFSN